MIRTISFYDMMLFDESRNIIQSNDEEKLENLLDSLGFDVKREYEIQICFHRPMSIKNSWHGPRIIGYEKKTKEWLISKHCTMENRLEVIGTKDSHLLRELLEMSKEGNFTSEIIQHMKNWSNK